jgi:hypothetical protein
VTNAKRRCGEHGAGARRQELGVSSTVIGYPPDMHGSSEPDVEADPQVARHRDTGGVDPDRKAHPDDAGTDPDGPSTTGTDENEKFVGRVAGQDAGYTGETGAEARAEEGSS